MGIVGRPLVLVAHWHWQGVVTRDARVIMISMVTMIMMAIVTAMIRPIGQWPLPGVLTRDGNAR